MNDYKEMIKLAYLAQKNAYIPYSNFAVGACLKTSDGKYFLGCNIESATFTPTSCGERTAFFKAVSEGFREFSAIAIVGNYADKKIGEGDFCAPCGVCRQVMAEFCDPKTFEIILAKNLEEFKVFKLEEIMPQIALPIKK